MKAPTIANKQKQNATHIISIDRVEHFSIHDGEFYNVIDKNGRPTGLKVSMSDRNWFIVKHLKSKVK